MAKSEKSIVSRRPFKRSSEAHRYAEVVLQPWFVPRPIAQTIIQLLPLEYRGKMHDYFKSYGCMKCERKKVMYWANGMCAGCCVTVNRRLRCCIRKRLRELAQTQTTNPADDFFAAAKVARKLLRDLVPGRKRGGKSREKKYINTINPANALFGPINRS